MLERDVFLMCIAQSVGVGEENYYQHCRLYSLLLAAVSSLCQKSHFRTHAVVLQVALDESVCSPP